MTEIVIAGAVRTAQAKLGGALRDFTHAQLGTIVVKGLLERARVSPESIDEVIMGCVGQSTDAPNVARIISVNAGLSPRVPAFTVGRNCASGLQAIVSAAHMILAGDASVVVAGGVEVMSSAPFLNRDLRFGKKLRNSVMIDSLWEGLYDPLAGMMMGETAEILAEEFSISRREQDEFAAFSHQKASQAMHAGKFKEEIVPVPIHSKKQKAVNFFSEDEGPNAEANDVSLGQYPATFKEGGTVTAGNSCQISDGAAAVLIASKGKAKELGLEVLATVKSWAFTGGEPRRMGLGPVDATQKALRRAGLSLSDMEVVEINEAFAAQYLAVEKILRVDRGCVNVNGGAIALGHPVGATGTRIIVTLLHELRRRGSSLGLASLCVGGGQGGALVLEHRSRGQ